MKKHAPTLLALAVVASLSLAGPIHTWSVGEVITSVDLNAALSHIHGTMVGGHGPRLVNADVSGSAAIAHTKLASPSLLPKVWIQVDCATTPGTCSKVTGTGATVAYGGSTGVSTITFLSARSDGYFGTIVSAKGTAGRNCVVTTLTTTILTVTCTASNTDAGVTDMVVNTDYTLLILDDNN